MREFINSSFKKLDYYSKEYENGPNRILSLLTFFATAAALNFYFIFHYIVFGTYEMVAFTVFGCVASIYSIYITVEKHKYLQAQYLMVVVVCSYVICSTYFLGYGKCAYIIFYPLLFAYFTISPTKEKHHTIAAIMTLIAYMVTVFIRFNVKPKYEDVHKEIEFVNLILSVVTTYYIVFTIDISETIMRAVRREKLDTLEKEANTDFLTGLYNKRYVEMNFKNNIEFIDCFTVMADIDFFKKVNDTYGHIVGDYTLKKVADLMKSIFRNDDVIVRWGGEEFLIIIKETNKSYVIEKLHTLRNNIKKYEFVYGENKFNITMTFGVRKIQSNVEFKENIRKTDNALYYGKQNGRDCIVYFDSENNFIKI